MDRIILEQIINVNFNMMKGTDFVVKPGIPSQSILEENGQTLRENYFDIKEKNIPKQYLTVAIDEDFKKVNRMEFHDNKNLFLVSPEININKVPDVFKNLINAIDRYDKLDELEISSEQLKAELEEIEKETDEIERE